MYDQALFIELTRRCNNKCKYCGSWRHSGTINEELSSEKYSNLFYAIKELNIPRINFTGGEPFLRNDLAELLRSANEILTGDIHLTTNGTLIKEYKHIFPLPVSLIKININTINFNTYKSITGTDNLNEVLDGVEYLHENKFPLRLHAVLCSDNVNEMYDIFKFCDENTIDIKIFEIDTNLSSIDKHKVDTCLAENYLLNTSVNHTILNSTGLPIHVYKRSNGNEVHLVKSGLQKYNMEICRGCADYPCHYGLYNVSITPDGYIYPCLIQPQRLKTKLDFDNPNQIQMVVKGMFDLIKESRVAS